VTIQTHSEPGGKVINEDYVIARRHPASASTFICILADGQGGQANGALAAMTASEAAWRIAAQLSPEQLFEDPTWVGILERADQETARTGGFTTLIALASNGHCAAGASCGDGKAYFRSPTSTEIAEWTGRQRKNPAVGSGAVDAVSFMHEGLAGGRLLLVSDGVWKYCGYEALKSSFALLPAALSAHFRAAIFGRAGTTLPDDLSFICADLD
jgi:serine/threonine protein phosphatase PrpC